MKVFVDEAGRDDVLEVLNRATAVAASPLAYVECRAAFARLHRDGVLSHEHERSAVVALDARWSRLLAIELDEGVRIDAGHLASQLGLRGADAVHLASAQVFASGLESEVEVACFDRRLWRAARAVGFATVPATEP